QGQNKRLFSALITLEQLRLKLPVAVLGDHQLQLAHPRLQRPRLVAVAPAPPHIVPLVGLGTDKTGHLSFKNLLHRALNKIAEKILPAQALLPSRHNLNTLSLASHLSPPPCECRLGKQHPKESTGWLASLATQQLLQNFTDLIERLVFFHKMNRNIEVFQRESVPLIAV